MKKLSAYLLLLSLVVILISACGSKNDTTETAPIPPSVIGIQLRVDAGNQQVTLYWPRVAGADTYNVYYSANSEPTKTSYDQKITGLTNTTHIATSLTNDTLYYFAITAVSTANGESALSEVRDAIPQGAPDPVPPEFPKNVRANAGNTTVTVTWTPVTGAEVYNLYQYSNFNNVTLNEIKSTDCTSSQCSFTATGLTNGTEYFFFLTAENNTSGKSNVVQAPVPSGPVENTFAPSEGLSAPQNAMAAAGDNQLILGWSPPAVGSFTSNSRYNVYRDTVYPLTPTTYKKFHQLTSPWTFNGLTNGTTYYLYVTAVLASGPSFGVSAIPTANPPPMAPFIITVTPGDGKVDLVWNEVDGATSYNVYSSNVMGLSKEVYSGKASGTGNAFTATDLTNDTKYYFVVTAVNAANSESAESYEVWAIPSASSPSSGLSGVSYMAGLKGQVTGSITIYAH